MNTRTLIRSYRLMKRCNKIKKKIKSVKCTLNAKNRIRLRSELFSKPFRVKNDNFYYRYYLEDKI